jgi:hypothetical protein
MLVTIVVILAIIPAMLLAIFGQSRFSQAASHERRQALVRFWLKAVVFLALPYALFSYWMFNNWLGIALLLIPVFIAVFSLLLVNWRSVYALVQSDPRRTSAYLLILALEIALSTLLKPEMLWLLLAAPLSIAALWVLFERLRLAWLTVAGWLLAAYLLLDAAGLAGSPMIYNQPAWRNAYHMVSGMAAMLAPLLAAALLWRMITALQAGQTKAAWSSLLLVGFLGLAAAAVTARYAVLVRATSRAAEDHIPIGTLAAGIIGGILLWIALGSQPVGAQRLGPVFLILAPGIVMLAYILGGLVDPLAVTESRAQRVSTLIESYRQEAGQYPPDLAALTPAYASWIPGPLTGRGQVWCYQSGADYYRLGYALFQRYYDWHDGTPFYQPYYAIQVPASAGQLPAGAWMCDSELEKLKEHGGL